MCIVCQCPSDLKGSNENRKERTEADKETEAQRAEDTCLDLQKFGWKIGTQACLSVSSCFSIIILLYVVLKIWVLCICIWVCCLRTEDLKRHLYHRDDYPIGLIWKEFSAIPHGPFAQISNFLFIPEHLSWSLIIDETIPTIFPSSLTVHFPKVAQLLLPIFLVDGSDFARIHPFLHSCLSQSLLLK